MKIFIGYDPRDHDAYRVCEQTIRENTSRPVEIIPLKEWELRSKGVYWRSYHVDVTGQMWDDKDGRPFSTQFSFTRFAVPILMDYADEWVLFCDADMMFRTDVHYLFDEIEHSKSLYCVQHNHKPTEAIKMDGVKQTSYNKKNWSSFMFMRPAGLRGMTPFVLNNWSGSALHGLTWCDAERIGSLDPRWNHLVGYDEPEDHYNTHFTLGTPDMKHHADSEWDGEWWDALDRANKGVLNEA